jgi:peptide/nickel transport system substrate-binding protein
MKYARFALALLLLMSADWRCAAAEPRDTLRINFPYTPKNLNPILSTTVYQNSLSRLFNDPLIATDASGAMVPMLARDVPTLANGGISRDGLRVTYRLRSGVRWQDGVPFTSRDIAFTWRAIMNPRNSVQVREIYAVVRAIDTPDATTAIVRLKHKAAAFTAEFMTMAYPLPEHLLGKAGELNDVAFNSLPIGVGPFRVIHWDRGSHIVLDANDDYYLGRPKLRHVVAELVTDENTAELQLRSHAVDVLTNISLTSYSHLRGTPGIGVILEHVNATTSLTMFTERPPLNDVRVRRAIALAVDRRGIAEKIGFGAVVPSNGADITNVSWAFDRSLPPTPFDPARARALLSAAGWTGGTDGGKRLRLSLLYSTGSHTVATTALLIAGMLASVGIDVDIKAVDSSILFAPASAGGLLAGGQFDLSLSGFQDYNDPDDSLQYSCESVAPAGFNDARYCNDELTRLQREALSSYDRAVRKRAYAGIERLILRDVPVDVLYWPLSLHVYAGGVHGLESRPGFLSPYRYLWSIDGEEVSR